MRRDEWVGLVNELREIKQDMDKLSEDIDPMVMKYFKVHNRVKDLLKTMEFYYHEEFKDEA